MKSTLYFFNKSNKITKKIIPLIRPCKTENRIDELLADLELLLAELHYMKDPKRQEMLDQIPENIGIYQR